MAENIVKLRVDSKDYDRNIRSAAQGLLAMEQACRKVSGTLEIVEQNDLEFVRALGDMETHSTSTKGQLRELSNGINDLTAMYGRLTDEEKSSPFGQALRASMDKLTERAGVLKDVMMDTEQAIKNASSDTRMFDQIAHGAQFAANSFQIATGTMQLFGVENENVIASMAKLQQIMAITNGLTQMQTLLQKQSALMQGVAAMKTKALAAAKALEKSETIGATVAQKAFNAVANANPYVLLATAVVSVGTALALFSSKASDAEEKLSAVEAASRKARENIVESKTKLDVLNSALRDNSKSLNERKSALNQLNELVPEYHGVLTDEGELINDNAKALKAYSDSLIKAARAQAFFDELVDVNKKKLKLVEELKELEKKGVDVDKIWRGENNTLHAPKFNGTGLSKQDKLENEAIVKVSELKDYEKQAKALERNINAIDLKKQDPPKETTDAEKTRIQEIDDAIKKLTNEAINATAERQEAIRREIATLKQEKQQLQEIVDYVNGKVKPLGKDETAIFTLQLNDNQLKAWEAYKEEKKLKATIEVKQEGEPLDIKDKTATATIEVKQEGDPLLLEDKKATASIDVTIDDNEAYTKMQEYLNLHPEIKATMVLEEHPEIKATMVLDTKVDDEQIQKDLEKSAQLTKGFSENTSDILTPATSIGDKYTKKPETNEQQFANLVKQYDQLSEAIRKAKEQNAESDGAIIDPEAIAEAESQLDVLISKIDEIGPTIEANMKFDSMMEGINKISSSFSQFDGMVSSIEGVAKSWEDADDALGAFHATMKTITTALSIFNTVMTAINSIQKVFSVTTNVATAATMANTAASNSAAGAKAKEAFADTGSIVALKSETASHLANASAQYFDVYAWMPFVGPGLAAGYSTLAAATVQATKAVGYFADGGIVGSDSLKRGTDTVPAMLTPGEIVLNYAQQNNIASALESKSEGGGGGRSTISGEQIVTVVNAYGRRTGRGEILR